MRLNVINPESDFALGMGKCRAGQESEAMMMESISTATMRFKRFRFLGTDWSQRAWFW